MVSWSTIQSAVLLLVPILYPRIRSFYNTIRDPPHPPRPLPRTTYALLQLLFVTGVLALLSSFPYFHPENIISRTNSRILQTSTDVIFTRLYNQRPALPSDKILKSRLTSRSGRLLYSLYGPGPLINCTWCRVDAQQTFLFYALPSILLPHLLHIAILGVVTSARFLGGNNKAGAIWRTQATLAGLILAATEIWYISTYSHDKNINARTAAESVYPHWQVLAARGIAIAVVDGILGYAIYLTGTGRWGALVADSPVESLEEVSKKLENSLAGLNSAVCLKQAIMRDNSLRTCTTQFWETEVLTGRELAQHEDVHVARRKVERRGDWARVKGEAKKRARAVARGLYVKSPPMDEDEDDDDDDDAGWNSPKNSQEVKQESRSTTQQSTLVGSGYFEDESDLTGTQDDELELEGMQYDSSSQESSSSSMAGSFP